jgi:hypothetical protein
MVVVPRRCEPGQVRRSHVGFGVGLGVLVLALVANAAVAPPARGVGTGVAPPAPGSVSESLVSVPTTRPAGRGDWAFEPVVATHPTDPSRLAVAYQRHRDGSIAPAIRISRDGGRTWADATGRPWSGSGRTPGFHTAIAWGPGPAPGSARLYGAATTAGGGAGYLLSIAWSDDEGRTWSKLHVERRTPPWIGGFPDITVDRDPTSPDYGVVYVVYNWPAGAHGPGLRLLASADFGRTWQPLEIPPATAPSGYPAAWRIDYRVRTGPDGSAYVAFFQADLRRWDSRRIFWTGGLANVGRVGYAVARVEFDRVARTFVLDSPVVATTLRRNAYTALHAATPGTVDNLADPMWSLGLDVDSSSGRVLLAVGDFEPSAKPRGTVLVGRSDDRGLTWAWVRLPPLPPVAGRSQSSFRPNLVADGGVVFVGLRGITDVPAGTPPSLHRPTIGVACSLSIDGGRTFTAPTAVTDSRWNAAALDPSTNGPGLRERAELTADGTVVYAYADGRFAEPTPDRRHGRSAVFAGLLASPTFAAPSLASGDRDHGATLGP